MQAYEGYIENGKFYPIDQIIRVPERKRAIITVLDEPVCEEKKPVRPPFAFGCMKGKVWMSDDFDEPLEDFKEYME